MEQNKLSMVVPLLIGLALGGGIGYYIGLSQGSPSTENPYAEVETNPLKDIKTNPLEGVRINPFE